MSRVGKQPVLLPSGVLAEIVKNTVTIKGKKGELKNSFPPLVKILKEDGKIMVTPVDESKKAKAAWGLVRTIINNMVDGVEAGFVKNLEVNGVGYRAAVNDGILTLQLGYKIGRAHV